MSGPPPASPNHGPRAPGKPVDILLLHYTGMPSAASALRWLCDPAAQVSCHYFVDEDGTVLQLVDEDRRAWHAGASCWQGETDINSRSIGIEIVNPGHQFGYRDFPDAQVAAVIGLCANILSRHAIPAERVLAHSDVAPERKCDPGERFPWQRLADAGIGLWALAEPAEGEALATGAYGRPVRALQRRLAAYGYRIAETGVFDWETEAVVTAFQRHFRPGKVDGVADAQTCATLDALLVACRR